MIKTCPQCGNKFHVKFQDTKMLAESYKKNSVLQHICPKCGKEVELSYQTQQKTLSASLKLGKLLSKLVETFHSQ